MSELIHPSWHPLLAAESAKPYFITLRERVLADRAAGPVYPPQGQTFAALQTPLDAVRCVIVGQDPYHGPGQAHGLAFSVPAPVMPPPSLQRIFQELNDDVRVEYPRLIGDLTTWAQRGVLLLNTVLTVKGAQPKSHAGIGWEQFTGAVLREVAAQDRPIVWMLWGSDARRSAERAWGIRIGGARSFTLPAMVSPQARHDHLILTAAHPAERSGAFRGCRHFSRCNEWLRRQGAEPIDWSLT